MSLDVLYLAKDRLEFTRFSFEMLLANTNWEMVDHLVVVDDGSMDGTRQWLIERIDQIEGDLKEKVDFYALELGSPVAIMRYYLNRYDSKYFAKIDNDIVVPPLWLERMYEVMENYLNRALELLGMAAGWTGGQEPDSDGWTTSSHIGGVGLMRTYAFRKRPPPTPNGRFGFTEWQHRYEPTRGWICPDVEAVELDKVPFAPWSEYSERYKQLGWQRDWPCYDLESSERFWAWWPAEARP